MVKVGDIVERPVWYGQGATITAPMRGTVVYVHPEGRYYTVEYEYFRNGERRPIRESYPLRNKTTGTLWDE